MQYQKVMEYPQVDRVLNTFIKAIIKGSLLKAYKYCQITWKNNNSKTKLNVLLQHNIDSYEIISHEVIEVVAIRVKVRVVIGGVNHITYAMVIREKAPYKPDEKGKWGVNPISFGGLKKE